MTPDRHAPIKLDQFEAFIFDTDGVVTDTASVHACAWKQMFDEFLRGLEHKEGGTIQLFSIDEDYIRYVDGRPRYDGALGFLDSRKISLPYGTPEDSPDQETVCGLANLKTEYFLELLKQQGSSAYEGSVEFVQSLKDNGIQTAVISASRNCTQVLESAGVHEIFDVKVDGVDSDQLGLLGKPDPGIFLEAARRLGVTPDRAVIVEDSLAGVEAGRRGAFGLVIGVDRSGHAEELKQRGADLVVRDLAELRLVSREKKL